MTKPPKKEVQKSEMKDLRTKLWEATAKAAHKVLGKDYTHVVLICLHKKLGEPILIFRGNSTADLVMSAKMTKFALAKLREQIAKMI
jgi:hypothetical protein